MKYLKITTLLLSLTLFFIVIKVSAQDDTNPTGLSGQGPGFICLDTVSCATKGACKSGSGNGHRVSLTTTENKGAPNSVAYIAECFDDIDDPYDGTSDKKPICSTGNSDLDKQLFCKAGDTSPSCDRYKVLQETIHYSISNDYNGNPNEGYGYFWYENGQFSKKVPPQALKTNGLGDIIPSIVEVQSSTPDKIMRRFVLFTTGVSTEKGTSGLGGQQQDILTFEERSQSCRGVSYDPEGRVFDAVSLEPIPQAVVAVKQLKEGGNRLMPSDFSSELASKTNLNILNPHPPTSSLGYYSFFLAPSLYYRLEATKGNYAMMQKADVAKLPANTSKIYFDSKTKRTSYFFQDSDAFYQQSDLIHYDIPLMPTNGGQSYNLELLTKNTRQSPDGKFLIYEGQVSHPFAKLTVQTCSNDPKVCNNPQVFTSQNGGPDAYGNFKILLDQSKLQSGQKFEPTFEKVDLATAPLAKKDIFDQIIGWMHKTIMPEVEAQTTGTTLTDSSIQPIVSYIEGFAYDTDGNLMPNATVELYVNFMDRPTYFTKANENGYYKITSENIPNGDYVIKYTSQENPAKTSTITTSQFTKQNADFIATEKVNPYILVTKTTDPRRTVTPSYVPQPKISAVPNEFPSASPAVTAAPAAPVESAINNNVFLIAAILLLLVATAGTLIGVYLYRKRMQEPEL